MDWTPRGPSSAHAMTPCLTVGGRCRLHPVAMHGLSARAPRGGVPSGSGRVIFNISVRSSRSLLPPHGARSPDAGT
ncbi:hypothetical protein SXCC_03077 [Gluconacetobacter sp. SXCC-1]|nr:hypothetical protein SXCC_03077 [Gluconacetobacter sp. SXCC-1]